MGNTCQLIACIKCRRNEHFCCRRIISIDIDVRAIYSKPAKVQHGWQNLNIYHLPVYRISLFIIFLRGFCQQNSYMLSNATSFIYFMAAHVEKKLLCTYQLSMYSTPSQTYTSTNLIVVKHIQSFNFSSSFFCSIFFFLSR